MSAADRDQPERVAARLSELEVLVTHMQQTIDDLNEVVIAQHRRIDGLELQLSRAMREMQSLGSPTEQRTPEEEKPPHY